VEIQLHTRRLWVYPPISLVEILQGVEVLLMLKKRMNTLKTI
jgi:hypothetical protein